MQFFLFLAAFLLSRRLQKSLQHSPLKAKWNSLLTIGIWSPIVIFCVCESLFNDVAGSLIGSSLLTGMVVFTDKETDFRPFRSFIRAHYPLIAAGFINGLAELIKPSFYEEHDEYFIFPILGAFIWIFARLASTKKQREEFRLVSEKNAQLDYLVAERTAELTHQKNELEETVKLLQTTQQQLIQSEKLASLGELTAGIAHEIQNPLNFVNNFSEVSMELIDEMEQELAGGNKEEAIAISGDIKQNLEKIRHHGRRADGIVKGMLQHSRASSNTKEPVNINTLADEYLRLAYHGLRAKDKTFNAELITRFNDQLPEITIVPQDIGRVLLNLFNNAFYAVQSRQKAGQIDYKPTVEVSTALKDKCVEITVWDNGIGIPDHLKEKIMQPFFTTKPTGEGTGLGLSLSYDIIVNGHGGKIDIDSEEGSYSEFRISIPA